MRLTSRLILSLALGIAVVAFLFAHSQVRAEKRGLRNDLEKRSEILAESLEGTVEPLVVRGYQHQLQTIVTRFGNRERLAGIAVYGLEGRLLAVTPQLTPLLALCPPLASDAVKNNQGQGQFFTLHGNAMHIYAMPLHSGDNVVGALAIFDNAAYIDAQSSRIWQETLLHVVVQVALVVLFTLLIIRWSIQGPISRMAQWMRAQHAGHTLPPAEVPEDFFKPIAREVTRLTTSLAAARSAAEAEARLRESGESLWTAERLRVHMQNRLPEGALFVVSNREPYMHVRRNGGTEVVVPASGLVTAMEPVLLACGGTWIAHGSGDADRENVDRASRLRVPPEQPQYTLRRVWLSGEEERGYYFGFANEGLWPLCHLAYTRPAFRTEDWEYYRQVNQKFANAVLEEMEGTEKPLLLIQDYHFALLPRLVKKERPDARISVFWHIPWPNPQVFGICPQKRELLDGLLGADLVGFHIQSHCNYFLETVDQVLESRIDWERFVVDRSGHRTMVRPFPISVSASGYDLPAASPNHYLERAQLFKRLGVEGVFLGVGVDRLDYTKGIIERFRGIERFLEKRSKYVGQFTFVQIGAPSRSEIQRYADLQAEVEREAERINLRFQTGRWKPIVLLKRHHSHKEIQEYYEAADVCLVTSLHDGMNLVAKEFVAARHDEHGNLILSSFTGAARELQDALIVNPYDTEDIATAIIAALEMDPEERRARMRRMRYTVLEHNIYRWAANLIGALSDIRLEEPEAGALRVAHPGSKALGWVRSRPADAAPHGKTSTGARSKRAWL
jgi:trehalose-6-phosphate synthase